MVKALLLVGLCALLLSSGLVIKDWGDDGKDVKLMSEDDIKNEYEGLFKLGLIPSAKSRAITEKDVDTGVRLTNKGNVYALIESRTFKTGDYGRTFVVKIN